VLNPPYPSFTKEGKQKTPRYLAKCFIFTLGSPQHTYLKCILEIGTEGSVPIILGGFDRPEMA